MKKLFWLALIAIVISRCSNFVQDNKKKVVEVSSPQITAIGVEEENLYVFRGIPYAEPPVGELRWKAPRPYQSNTPYDASRFKSKCVQPSEEITITNRRLVSGNEDCLYLNVVVPKNSAEISKNKFPVMFWIHGGSNIWGSGDYYDYSRMAELKDVIVVSINYRLGIFGWFSSDFIRETSSDLDLSPNFGQLDIIEALKWVQNNISAYGGDPDNVTIFGESAGGHNILTLLASPLTKGLFHKAISQSGYIQSHSLEWATSGSELSSERIFEEDIKYLTNASEIMSYLRGLSSDEVYEKYIDTAEKHPYPITPITIRDGIVVPKNGLYEGLEKVDPNLVIVAGTNKDEMNLWYINSDYFYQTTLEIRRTLKRSEENLRSWNRYRSDIWRYRGAEEPLRRMAESNDNLYSYRFDWDEQSDNIAGNYALFLGASHGLEIPFLSNNFSMRPITWYMKPILFPESSAAGRDALSEQMITFWTNIAKYGDPNAFGNFSNWEKFNMKNQAYLTLDNPKSGLIQMVNNPVRRDELLKDLESDSTLEIKERCVLGWIAVRQFSEFNNPKPPFSYCNDFSEEELALFRKEVEGSD